MKQVKDIQLDLLYWTILFATGQDRLKSDGADRSIEDLPALRLLLPHGGEVPRR